MSRHRHRRKAAKQHRHTQRSAIVREATRVQRLAYTRTQAAEALGISRSTFNRRVLPYIEIVEMPWGARLIPVDELERVLVERRRKPEAEPRPPARPGRRSALSPEVVARIRRERVKGKSLGEIARGLNTDAVRTSQGGRQWWPSTVRAVLVRQSARSAQASTSSR